MTEETLSEKDYKYAKEYIYDPCGYRCCDFQDEVEGSEYGAFELLLNSRKVKCRSAKITPKKIGQFVTLWQRNLEGVTEPHDNSCDTELFIIHVRSEKLFGQFIFPKEILYQKGIISGEKSLGKRGFRVYPSWDSPESRQAKNTQQWQLNYFLEVPSGGSLDLERAKKLLST